jgi:CheY-like chemotaxis protein
LPEIGLPIPAIQIVDDQAEETAPVAELPIRPVPAKQVPVVQAPVIEVPVAAPPVIEQPPPLPPPPPPKPSPRSVLVLDDDDALRKLVRRMLEREGHRVYEVGSEKETLTRLRTYRFDLVILNLDLSEPEGLALVRGIQRNHPDVKLVALCDIADAQTLNAEIPTLPVVTKPLATQALLERVRIAFRDLEVGT